MTGTWLAFPLSLHHYISCIIISLAQCFKINQKCWDVGVILTVLWVENSIVLAKYIFFCKVRQTFGMIFQQRA